MSPLSGPYAVAVLFKSVHGNSTLRSIPLFMVLKLQDVLNEFPSVSQVCHAPRAAATIPKMVRFSAPAPFYIMLSIYKQLKRWLIRWTLVMVGVNTVHVLANNVHKTFDAACGNANFAKRIYEEQYPQRHIPELLEDVLINIPTNIIFQHEAEELAARIILAFDDLRNRPQIFRRIRRSIIRRYTLCVNNGGHNFEQFL
ncbi:hypothetical protein ANN_26427 [Periplaneta americana]|uniref:Uncharacterized protein n=1 Tax=Periplaneta americana TaxID=6978 RepID=A0ABQ8RY49_PERAM|nr:hypothetical protein ANN_26427 [Periplaneta americana]